MARPLEFDRCEAVKKAKVVFHRNGYEATSIDDLTTALGISRASLYNTFGDKHGLLMATLDAASQEGEQVRENACGRQCGTKKIVREMFEALAERRNEGCYLLTLGAELSNSDPEVQKRVQASLEMSWKLFADLVKRDKSLSKKQVEAKAAVLLGAMVSILTLTRVHPDPVLLGSVIEQSLTVLD